MIPYSLHVAILLAICLLFYKLLLQKETYYGLNRIILLSCIALAFVLPLIPVQERFSFRSAEGDIFTAPPIYNVTKKGSANATVLIPSSDYAIPVFTVKNILRATFCIYWCGVMIFGINLLIQVVALLYQSYKKPFIKDGIFRIVEISDNKAPCSFGNTIFINPAKYDWETYNQILMHEKVHIRQKHSFDLLIAELMLLVQWFNPFAWLFRKEMENNLEFLTDYSLLYKNKVEPADYQLSLLKVSVPNFSMRITTNYNQSLLKKRILMMNAKRSNIHSIWKYLLLLPLSVILACTLNKPISEFSGTDKTIRAKNQGGKVIKDHSPLNLSSAQIAPAVSNRHQIPVKQKANITTSSATGKINLSENNTRVLQYNGVAPRFIKEMLGIYPGIDVKGIIHLQHNGVSVEYAKEIRSITPDADAHTVVLFMHNGISSSYVKDLRDAGITDFSLKNIYAMQSIGMTAAYVKSLHRAGLKDLSLNTLRMFQFRGITADEVKRLKDKGYSDADILQFYNTGSTPVDSNHP